MKCLDPKADLTFKKVFGENKDLVISFLNALLPLPEDAPIEEVETSAYTPAQMEGYDKFWDIISVEKCLLGSAEERGMKRGMERGMEIAKIQYVHKMLQKGFDHETIMELTGLTNEEVEKIKGLM